MVLFSEYALNPVTLGGLHRALERSCVNGSVIRAYDWDQAACQVYQVNYEPGIVKQACSFPE